MENRYPSLDAFQPLRKIGEGGQGSIYQGTGPDGRTYAIKVFHERIAFDRVERELSLAHRVSSHPNIVTTYGGGISREGRVFTVMEFAGNGSLAQRKYADQYQLARVGAAIANALAWIHGHGIVHTDVSPANILFTTYGTPVLSDLTSAVGIDNEDRRGFTRGFAPPERIRQAPADPSGDVFSLAASLVYAFAGHRAQPVLSEPTDADYRTHISHLIEALSLDPPIWLGF